MFSFRLSLYGSHNMSKACATELCTGCSIKGTTSSVTCTCYWKWLCMENSPMRSLASVWTWAQVQSVCAFLTFSLQWSLFCSTCVVAETQAHWQRLTILHKWRSTSMMKNCSSRDSSVQPVSWSNLHDPNTVGFAIDVSRDLTIIVCGWITASVPRTPDTSFCTFWVCAPWQAILQCLQQTCFYKLFYELDSCMLTILMSRVSNSPLDRSLSSSISFWHFQGSSSCWASWYLSFSSWRVIPCFTCIWLW